MDTGVRKGTVFRIPHTPSSSPPNLWGRIGWFQGGFPYSQFWVRSAKAVASRRALAAIADQGGAAGAGGPRRGHEGCNWRA